MFICGSGCESDRLSAFRKIENDFWCAKTSQKRVKLYLNWCRDVRFDEKKNVWYLKWEVEKVRDYYLNFLLLHELGHFVESVYQSFGAKPTNVKVKILRIFCKNLAFEKHRNNQRLLKICVSAMKFVL
jgi:hypothetical protein